MSQGSYTCEPHTGPCLTRFPANLPMPRFLPTTPLTLTHAQDWLHYLLAGLNFPHLLSRIALLPHASSRWAADALLAADDARARAAAERLVMAGGQGGGGGGGAAEGGEACDLGVGAARGMRGLNGFIGHIGALKLLRVSAQAFDYNAPLKSIC